MSDFFMSEKDGGAFSPVTEPVAILGQQGNSIDIAMDDGPQSVAYCLLFGGNTALAALRGEPHTGGTFEESMDVKVSVSNLDRQEARGTKQLQTMVEQGLVKSASVKSVNSGLERVEIYVNFVLLDGSPISDKIAVFENGVMI